MCPSLLFRLFFIFYLKNIKGQNLMLEDSIVDVYSDYCAVVKFDRSGL